jgi:hypothetical protein
MPSSLAVSRPDAGTVTVGRDAERDVGWRCQVTQLVAKNRSHAAAGGDAGHRRHVGCQRDSEQSAFPDDDRVHELDGHVLRVSAGPAGTEGD